ncbi:MAG: hypothetical protein ACOYMV_14260 [Verrucomicrobiia bacterium]
MRSRNNLLSYDGCWTRVTPGQAGGFDWQAILGTLERLGYRGWLNVMCATDETEDPIEIAKGYLQVLGGYFSTACCAAARSRGCSERTEAVSRKQ